MGTISGKNDGRLGSGGEEVTEEIVLWEIAWMVKGEGAEESTKKVVRACEGWVREAKEGMVCEAPGCPGERGWERFGGIGEVRIKIGGVRGIGEGARRKMKKAGEGCDKGADGLGKRLLVEEEATWGDVIKDAGQGDVNSGIVRERERGWEVRRGWRRRGG